MSDINSPPTAKVRRPRGAIKLDGALIDGWTAWEVENNAYRSADTFRVVFVVSMLPKSHDAAWFSDQSSIKVEIFATEDHQSDGAYTPANADRLILGNADEICFDPVQGTIELSGRDLTARLIDTKTSEHWANKTASQIATVLATRHGLNPVVVATKTRVGDYYKDDHANVTQQQSEWELLTYLANVEDYSLYVRGEELHFEPRAAEQADHYVITWDAPTADRAHPISNAIGLQFTRALNIARGVAVEVHSWNAKHKKGFSVSWPKAAKAVQPGQAEAKTQIYRYTIGGLDPDSAMKRAQSLYKQIVAHEKHLAAYLPGDGLLDCAKTIAVRGTGTSFDQVYYPESVTRTMSVNEGYRMNVRAKNTGPDLEDYQ